jgi:hypothetical protein
MIGISKYKKSALIGTILILVVGGGAWSPTKKSY